MRYVRMTLGGASHRRAARTSPLFRLACALPMHPIRAPASTPPLTDWRPTPTAPTRDAHPTFSRSVRVVEIASTLMPGLVYFCVCIAVTDFHTAYQRSRLRNSQHSALNMGFPPFHWVRVRFWRNVTKNTKSSAFGFWYLDKSTRTDPTRIQYSSCGPTVKRNPVTPY